jgi:glycosyltransferase involved in cell wall biosynthesis
MDLLPNYQLLLVGTGDLDQKIHDLIEVSPSKERIVFKGPVLPNELLEITRKAYIGLNLLEPRSQSYFFSLANKFFDYIVGGIPSINMDFPVYRQYLSEYRVGEMISELNPETLANAINKIASSDNYHSMEEQISNAAKVWVWENEEVKLWKMIDSVLLKNN